MAELPVITPMEPVRIGRAHMIPAMVLVAVGLVVVFNAAFGEPSWLASHELQAFLGYCALFAGIIWAGGRVGWWIVRHIIQWWFHHTFSDANKRR
jgi:hypothetical protein